MYSILLREEVMTFYQNVLWPPFILAIDLETLNEEINVEIYLA